MTAPSVLLTGEPNPTSVVRVIGASESPTKISGRLWSKRRRIQSVICPVLRSNVPAPPGIRDTVVVFEPILVGNVAVIVDREVTINPVRDELKIAPAVTALTKGSGVRA